MPPVTQSASHFACHGCALCLLCCPMWQQTRDVAFSAQGVARALQHGANGVELAEPVAACLRCGVCELICPQGIELAALFDRLAGRQTEPQPNYYRLSCHPQLPAKLGPGDLYIIDAASFHADHAERIGHYLSLRQMSGCQLNLDLHRMAIPTGIGHASPHFDVARQIEWLTRGRKFDRLVVENPAECATLTELTGKPAVSLAELLGI